MHLRHVEGGLHLLVAEFPVQLTVDDRCEVSILVLDPVVLRLQQHRVIRSFLDEIGLSLEMFGQRARHHDVEVPSSA